MESKTVRRSINITAALLTLLSLGLMIYGLKTGLFVDQAVLEDFLQPLGLWAPLMFILFQAIQVIFPILPGGIGLLGGVLIFGPWYGFLYNYIGICLGSLAAFLLAKYYGRPIIRTLFGEKLQKKYEVWSHHKRFDTFFTWAIFLPIAPDDFLCYLAGTTNMKLKRFVLTILFGKPLAIAAYSFGLSVMMKRLIALF